MSVDLSYVVKFPVLFLTYLLIFFSVYKFLYWAFNLGKRQKSRYGASPLKSKSREISFKFKEDNVNKRKNKLRIPENDKLFMYESYYDKKLIPDEETDANVEDLKLLFANLDKNHKEIEEDDGLIYFKGLRNNVLEESKNFVYAQINPENNEKDDNKVDDGEIPKNFQASSNNENKQYGDKD